MRLAEILVAREDTRGREKRKGEPGRKGFRRLSIRPHPSAGERTPERKC